MEWLVSEIPCQCLLQTLVLPLAQWLDCVPYPLLLLHWYAAAIALPLPVVVHAASAAAVVHAFWYAVSSSHAIEIYVHIHCTEIGDCLYVWVSASLCYQDKQMLCHRYDKNTVSLQCADANGLWGGRCGRMSSHKFHSWKDVQSCAQTSGVCSKLRNLQKISHK